MRFEIPKEFIEVIMEIEKDVRPGSVINWLEWASRNPEEAKRLAEAYRGLGWSGRHELATALWCGESPDHAIKSAIKYDKEYRKKRSLLSRAIANAKKDGYRFTMPNGVECTVVRDKGKDAYWFNFKVAGEEIGILYGHRGLLYALESWGSGYASKYNIEVVFYKDKFYAPYTDIAKTLVRAVEENMKPEVLATVNP